MPVSAKVVEDSKHCGNRLITLEIELHRFILPEFNTHRTFSRNFQSSRAIPLARQRKLVNADPALPVYWGSNKAGMVAGGELSGWKLLVAQALWLGMLKVSTIAHHMLDKLGVHKQLTNRLLEPWMFTRGVVTATEKAFEAFFKLRCDKDAQPEIKALADAMKQAIDGSTPKQLEYGQWHMPYVDMGKWDFSIDEALKVSASCCAQVSYRNLDDSVDKAIRVYDMLNLDGRGGNPHASPCEHQAQVGDTGSLYTGNLPYPFKQYRGMLDV